MPTSATDHQIGQQVNVDIENSHGCLLTSGVPRTQKEYCSWKITCVQDAEDASQRKHSMQRWNKSKGHDNDTPDHNDRREEDTRPNLATQNCHRWLERNVDRKEDENQDRVKNYNELKYSSRIHG